MLNQSINLSLIGHIVFFYIIGHIIEDAKILESDITGAFLVLVSRQETKVSHRLTLSSLHSPCDRSWFEKPPNLILDLLMEHCKG